MTERAHPWWESAAIALSLVALGPAAVSLQMREPFLPTWLAWTLLGLMLGLMAVVFVRRLRRLHRLRPEDGTPGPPLFPPPPDQPPHP